METTLNNDQLKQVGEYAELLFTPEEIGVIMGLPEDFVQLQMILNTSDFKSAYQRGRLLSEAAIRKGIIDLAKKGSSPAQILAVQLIDQLIRKEVKI